MAPLKKTDRASAGSADRICADTRVDMLAGTKACTGDGLVTVEALCYPRLLGSQCKQI